jgi:DNA excision repair protein ERCC-1
MSERRFAIPTVEQIEERKRKSKGTNYFQSSVEKVSQEEPLFVTPLSNVTVESTEQTPSSVVTPRPQEGMPATWQQTGGTPRRSGPNTVLVNQSQRGNPILQHVRNVPWEYDDIKADYVVGQTTCVLYLRYTFSLTNIKIVTLLMDSILISLRYHRLHPDYIYDRMGKLAHQFVLRLLLVYVDIDNHQDSIRELTKTSVVHDFTIMLAWSYEEAGRYLETFKAYEHKSPDIIRERSADDYMAKLTESLTQIRSVNKTDVLTLKSTFGSLEHIINAPTEALALCPGFGEQKVRRLQQAFTQPFIVEKHKRQAEK